MRLACFLACALSGAAAFAGDGFAGTKVSGGAAGAAPSSAPAMLQMLLALGVVLFLLKFMLPRMAAKLNRKLVAAATSSLHVEESASFAGGSLYVVRARRKVLLLSVTGSSVACLADLSDGEAAAPRQTFDEVLERAKDPVETLQPGADVERALQRLERLAR